jgi:hypothetical protein
MKKFVSQRLSGKLIVLVPIKNSLEYESSEEGVDCDVCSEKIPIRLKDARNSVFVARNDALTK